jgi:hypothetical protein
MKVEACSPPDFIPLNASMSFLITCSRDQTPLSRPRGNKADAARFPIMEGAGSHRQSVIGKAFGFHREQLTFGL